MDRVERRSRPRRALAALGRWSRRALVILLLLALVVTSALLVAFKTSWGRALVAGRANAALEGVFAGKLRIERLGRAGFGGVGGLDLVVLDPSGRFVIDADGCAVEMAWPGLVLALLAKPPEDVTIVVDHASCDHVEVRLIDDLPGGPSIARAFEPEHPSPAGAPGSAGPTVVVRAIRIGHAWVHGAIAGGPAIDVDVGDVRASLRSTPVLGIDLEHARLTARALPAISRTRGVISGSLRVREGTPGTMLRFALDGTVLSTGYSLQGQLDLPSVRLELRAPRVTPELVSRLSPALVLDAPLSLLATATGTLNDLAVRVAVNGPPGVVEVTGTLSAGGRTRIAADVRTLELDLRKLVRGAPATDLDLDGRVSLELGKALGGAFRIRSAGSTVAGEQISALDVRGSVSQSKKGGPSIDGVLRASGSGVSVAGEYRFIGGASPSLAANVRASVASRSIVRRIAGVEVAGEVDASVRYDLERGQVLARLDARLGHLEVEDAVTASDLRVDAVVSGAVRAPSLDARVSGAHLEAGGVSLRRVSGRVRGSLDGARVTARADLPRVGSLKLALHVSILEEGVRVRGLELVRLRREQDVRAPLRAKVGELRIEDGGIVVHDMELTGVGRVRASFEHRDTLRSLEFQARGVDMARLARELGVDVPIVEGLLTAGGRYSRATGDGKLRGTAQGTLEVPPRTPAEASRRLPVAVVVDLGMDDAAVSGRVSASLGGASIRAVARRVRLAPRAFQRPLQALGEGSNLTVEGDVDLASLDRTGLLASFGIERAEGKLMVAAHLVGSSGGRLPSVIAGIHTMGLELVAMREDVPAHPRVAEARRSAPRALRGIDGEVTLLFSSAPSEVIASGRLFDARGTLVELDGRAEVPGGLASDLRLLSTARDWPAQAVARLRERDLRHLPARIRPATFQGRLAAVLRAEGTLRRPEVVARVSLARFRETSPTEPSLPPIDLRAEARYRATGGSMVLRAWAAKREAMSAEASWSGDLLELPYALSGDRPSPVAGHLDVAVRGLPLGALPLLRAQNVRGTVDARLTLENLGRDPRLDANVRVRRLAIGQAELGELELSSELIGDDFTGSLEYRGKASSGHLEGSATVIWRDRVAPSRVEGRSLVARLDDFELATVLPLVRGPVSELSGKVSANVRVLGAEASRSVNGRLSILGGSLQLPAIGQRFRDIDAALTLTDQQVTLESLRASGVTGRLHASGSARLEGFDVTSAEATLRIDEDQKLPITLEGVSLGDAWGEAKISYVHRHQDREGKTTRIDVRLPELHVALPALAPDGVQELEPAPTIDAGFYRGDGRFVTLPLQPVEKEQEEGATRIIIRVELGPEVWVHQGAKLDAQFRGGLRAELAEDPSLRGRVALAGGTLDVSGKRFQLERGTITFNGPVEEAVVVATARWESPTEYTVYAEFTGTVADGEITLRSEPPLTQDEILNLLLFGTPAGTVTGAGSNTATALSVAGDSATKGLNQLLARFTELDLSARIDTSTGSARPELVWELSPRLTARLTRALGEPRAQTPDRTFLTLELRLRQRWSISTTVGDRGSTGLEVLWRVRF